MKNKKTYAIFGLGRYGTAVAKELVENGLDVIAVDIDQKSVNDAAAFLPVCKCADVTDREVLHRLGISNIDVVIICMANSFESTVMAITLCKELGVETVIAKCNSEVHKNILLRVGADKVVFPEVEAGIHLAKILSNNGFVDFLSLSKEVSMVKFKVKDEWVGKNLIELNLRKKYGINVVAIQSGEKVNMQLNPEDALEKDCTLIVITDTARLNKLL